MTLMWMDEGDGQTRDKDSGQENRMAEHKGKHPPSTGLLLKERLSQVAILLPTDLGIPVT